jgi:type I restriction enzyme, S subunit
MIDGLEPYPNMKDSGVPCLGHVPESWEVPKLRHLLRRRTERNRPELPLLSVVRDRGVILRDLTDPDGNHNFIPDDLSNYKVVRPGQFAMNKMKAWQGSYGVSPHDGIVSPAYFVFDLAGVEGRFFHTAIRSRAYVPSFAQASDGVRIGQWDLAEPRMREIAFAIPPLPEQAAIVRFLDHADRRIRRYIRAKQKLIKLLEEQIKVRASIAMRNPATRQERLGGIAKQELRPVARVNDRFYTPLGLFNRGRGLFHKSQVVGGELGDSIFFWVEPGDLVISGQFAWEGAVTLASLEEKDTVVSHRYYLLRGQECKATTPYLWALLRSDFGQMLLDQHSRGAAGRNRPLNLGKLLKEKVPVPPIEAQLAVDELVHSMSPIRNAINADMALLREFRTRLIADVVTGKLDVREAAAKLPDQVPEPEALDEIDDLSQDESTAGDLEVEADEAA